MTNLTSDFREKSIKNELEIQMILRALLPLENTLVMVRKGGLKQKHTITKRKPNMVNSKVGAVQECEAVDS